MRRSVRTLPGTAKNVGGLFMKKRLISFMLCFVMVMSACVLCFTGCSGTKTDDNTDGSTTTRENVATTLVMWCVTEEGTDDEQAKAVAEAMSEMTKSKYKTKLIVKYFTPDEYFAALEEALAAQELAAEEKAAAAAVKKANEKRLKELSGKSELTAEEQAEYEELQRWAEELQKEEDAKKAEEDKKNDQNDNSKTDGNLKFDENGNPVIDTTVYPEVEDGQVDIIYISGYDRYKKYIENEWLASLNSELTGSGVAKKIANYVSTSLLSAVSYNGTTYSIPNNNAIGEYTYMLIDKALYDKYYYTAYLDDVHSITDLASFLEDIATYEEGVLPINGDVDYCMSLLADYWDIDATTLKVTGNFSVLGYAHKDGDKNNRGDIAYEFNNLLNDEVYVENLKKLKELDFKGYFHKAEEGQRSAVSFVTGDAAMITEYEKDYYYVVVDYPRAGDDDIYDNMFGVSAYSSDVTKSMEVITLLNTDEAFRNLFQYGIEGTNYHKNSDGTVTATRSNGYHMDCAKTGNEFIAYVPEGTNIKVWEYAKQQNRESLVAPLLGFDFNMELNDQTDEWRDEVAEASKDGATIPDAGKMPKEYVVEKMDTTLITYLSDLSKKVWAEIQACSDMDELDATIDRLAKSMTAARDENIKRAMVYTMVELEYDEDGEIKLDADDKPTVTNPTVTSKASVQIRKVMKKGDDGSKVEGEEKYLVITKTLTPYQIYYRWMSTYGYLPAGFGAITID